ncbi:(2Fe-2S)-binding protein [Paraburkholderia phenazinium]
MAMFTRLQPSANAVEFTFEGELVSATEGDTVAAALLAHGVECFRTTPVTGAPRQPHCMIGNCFDCLVEIDGIANCQSCLVVAKPGMKVTHQDGPGEMELL